MPFRFNAAAGARGARGLARQASRRLSLLASTGDASAAVAARGGGHGRPPPATATTIAPSSSTAAVARARSTGLTRDGRDTALAVGAPEGQARRFTSPAGVTSATIDCYRCPSSGHRSTAALALSPAGSSGSGGGLCRGLATTPARAATEGAVEDTGGNGFGGISTADDAGGEQRHVAPAAAAEVVHGAQPTSAGDGERAGANSGGSGGGGGGSPDAATTTASDASSGSSGGASHSLEESNEELRAYAKRGEGDKAVALIARMREAGVAPTARSYTSAINACKKGKEAQWEQALALLRETATAGGGVTPNAYHYTAAIKTCGNAHQWGQVLSLKAEMDSLGITPGAPYYHWMLKSVAVAGPGGDGAPDEAGRTCPPLGWETVKDLVTEMSAKAVVPNLNTFALVRHAKSRLTPRSGDSGSGDGGDEGDAAAAVGNDGDGSGEIVDAELEWAFGVLRGIDGAPEPWIKPTLSARNPERPPAKAKHKKQQKPPAAATVNNDEAPESAGSAGGNLKKVREQRSLAPSTPSITTASVSSKRGDHPPGPAGGPAWDPRKYYKKLREHAKLGDGDKAVALIARMREAGVAPTARSYTSAINACRNGEEAQWEQALALLRETATAGGGVAPNAYHYTAAIKTCGYARQWGQIPALISEMESRGIRPDVELYNWAIKAASAPRAGPAMRAILTREGGWRTPGQPSSGGGRKTESPSLVWEAATGLLRDMSSKGVAPSSITYTLVISACQKDREPERALAVLREMQELAAAATSSETPASPKSEDSAEGDPEQAAADGAAAAAVEEGAGGSGGAGLDDSGGGAGGGAGGSGGGIGASPSRRRRRAVTPNVFHYSTVMSAFAERPGGWKRILALIKEMEAAGVTPNAYTYNSAMMACGRDGRWAEAVAVFRRMPKRGVVPDEVSFLAVIEACRQGDQWALAVALLREMFTTPIRVRERGATAAAETAAGATTIMSPTVEAYTAALTACGNAGQWEVAVGLLREVTDGVAVATAVTAGTTSVNGGAGVEADAGTAAAYDDEEGDEGCDPSGEGGGGGGGRRKDGAAAAAAAATAEVEPVPLKPVPLKPDLFLYNAAIEACGNAGQWERALKLLSEISEIGLSPSVVSYNSTIAACAGADQWQKAVALLDEMRVVGLVPVSSTFLPAIEACQRAGEGKLAYALTRERDETQRRMKGHPEFRSMKRGQRKR